MQVVVNQKLVRNRVRIASAFHLSALAVFAVGLFLSWNQPDQILGSYTSIVVGLLLYNFGQFYLRRWGPRHRQDAILTKALKGLDNRHTFLAFASSKLPDYMVVGPLGVQVVVPRSHDGNVTCRADRWTRETRGGLGRIFSLFGGNPLGDPGVDLGRGVQKVREHLRKRGVGPTGEDGATDGDDAIPVGGVVVFTNPTVKLRIEGCSYPITRLKQLRSNVAGGKGPVNPRAVAQVVQALEG